MMFPMQMPEMPQEIMDAVAADPGAFAAALGQGMEAFQGAMNDGGDMGAAFEAMGDVMGPVMEGMGVSPEAFDAAGDAFGAAIGGGMHMAPADCGGPEMGAIMQDAVEMMMPEGTEVPAPVNDALGDMGQGFADAGCAPHDMAGEMMPPPGDAGFPFPCDPAGDCVVPAGDPAACPADACQPPPMDGACADMGGAMMPPEGGYDHAPMPADAVMPPPLGEMADAGGMDALSDALGGPATDPAADAAGDMGGVDAAIGAAMDSAMEQGGAPAPEDAAAGPADDMGAESADEAQEVDPSAGMG